MPKNKKYFQVSKKEIHDKDLQIKYNLTYLFISHNLSVVRYLANTVAIMYLGRIVEQGPVEELFNNPEHNYTKELIRLMPKIESII